MGAVFRRELNEYFYSMLGYVFISAFLFLAGIMFVTNNILPRNASFNTTLNDYIYVFMMTAPLLTMRLISEEKRTKRDQLLLTSQLSLGAIVLGKYFAAFLVYAFALLMTVIYSIILVMLGNPSVLMILNGYLGLLLIGAAILAVGLFVSSLTENQLSAALGTYGLLLLFLMLHLLVPQIKNTVLVSGLEWFSLFKRFDPFQYGTLSVSSIVYYASFSVVFLMLSTMVMERRRWRTT